MAATQAATLGTASGIGEDIVLRRGGNTLASQVARVSKAATARTTIASNGRETRQAVLLTGGTSFDVEVQDRFNDQHGILYEVVFVRANRQIDTVAECEAVQ